MIYDGSFVQKYFLRAQPEIARLGFAASWALNAVTIIDHENIVFLFQT